MSDSKETFLIILPWDITHAGGVNSVVTSLYDGVSVNGSYRPMILVHSWPDKNPRQDVVDGRDVVYFRLRAPITSEADLREFLAYVLSLPADMWRTRKLLRSLNVQVINFHYLTLSTVSVALLAWTGLYTGRLICSAHGSDIRNAATASRMARRMYNWVLGRASSVIACSDGLRQRIARYFPACRSRVRVIYNGLDVQKVVSEADDESDWAKSFDNLFVLSIGNFLHIKGHDILLRAFHDACQDLPKDLDLVIVGRSGDTYAATVDLVRDLGLTSRVHLITDLPHDKCMALLARAEFFILPSRREAFSVVLLEAGALAKGVIASDVDGVRELISDPSLGIVVTPKSVGDLRDSLIRLADSSDLAKRLGTCLRRRVESHYTSAIFIRNYLDAARGRSAQS